MVRYYDALSRKQMMIVISKKTINKTKHAKTEKEKKLLIQYIIIGLCQVQSKITSFCPKKLTYTYPKSMKCCIYMKDQY